MSKKTLSPSELQAKLDDKRRKFMEKVGVAYDRASLGVEECQYINEAVGLTKLIEDFIGENRKPNDFAEEQVPSKYGYLSGYKPGVQDLDRQITKLKELFPGLGGANSEYVARVKAGQVVLPKGAEKFGAVPNWKKRQDLFGSNYNEVVQKALDTISQTRDGKFVNYREGQLGPDRLRQSEHSIEYWDKLIEDQRNPDIIVVPFQFGKRHVGSSVRRARVVIRASVGEFGFGAFAVGMLILTHPERLQHFDDLWLDCPGDEYDDPDSDVRFDHAPFFHFDGGGVRFGTSDVSHAHGNCGSASGFVPQ